MAETPYDRFKILVGTLHCPSAAWVLERAHSKVTDALDKLDTDHPTYRTLERIQSWTVETARKNLKREVLIREFAPLICEVFAERNVRPELSLDEKKVEYLQYLIDDLPLFAKAEGPGGDATIFPFSRVTLPPTYEASADLFYDAYHQGLDAIAKAFDIERAEYAARIKTILDLRADRRGHCQIHYIGGHSGSGKTTVLDRLAYDGIVRGWSVYRCDSACIDKNSFFERLHAVTTALVPTLVLIDDAHYLPRRGVDLRAFEKINVPPDHPPAVVVLTANWHLCAGYTPLASPAEKRHRSLSTMTLLSDTELDALIDKLLQAERTGQIKQVKCTLPEAERRYLLSDHRDRVMAIALLKLRYGKNVREIVQDEFDSIPTSMAKRLYALIAIFERLDVPLSASLVFARCGGDIDTIRSLRSLTRVDHGKSRLRHPLLVRPTIDAACPGTTDRLDLITDHIVNFQSGDAQERHRVVEIFRSDGVPRRIFQLARYELPTIRDWTALLSDFAPRMEECGFGSEFHSFLGTLYKDILRENEIALGEFQRAWALDDDNTYAARQIGWCLLGLGKIEEAEVHCGKLERLFDDDVLTLSDCAFILSWCSTSGFDEASRLYEKLKDVLGDDGEYKRRVKRHAEAKHVRDVLPSSDYPDWALEQMRAPAFIWRVRRNAVKYYNRALFNQFRGSLRNTDLGPNTIADALESLETRDSRLRALARGTVARAQYERWYHDGEDIDLDELEGMFREAIREFPGEPFLHCWFGTFLKEARRDYGAALSEYIIARQAAKESKSESIIEHPMILNNIALLKMDSVYLQKASPESAFKEASELLKRALKRIEDDDGNRFQWPIDTQARLKAMASEFNVDLEA